MPSLGERGTPQVTRNGCNQNIELTWDKGSQDEAYSVFLSRSPSAEPDDTVDTTSQSFVFENVKAGTNYLHIKPGNSCGWGQSKYWEVKVEDVEPSLELSERVNSEDDRDLIIYSDCAQKIQIKPLGATYSQNSKVINLQPKKDIEYTVTAINGKATKTDTIKIAYPLPTPTPTYTPEPTFTPISTNPPQVKGTSTENEKKSFWNWLKQILK